jgi:hypothetical protein
VIFVLTARMRNLYTGNHSQCTKLFSLQAGGLNDPA